ncbi:cyclic dehypoxanthinyl futalosine synthase [Stratiformator vulcanicus]|uniref:Cyclic dehypoxanthine futalosine synthase n=1 Tax=Stratiformator vulcanicus TaxID=2527980 RepID=A0A517R6T4_9PLAN|nr:cyclic dehypoxanthinyl futalosine synthase [Stratiformator vulcanicus]QDT39553.1 Aminodeoxyfutalosine synthase [Stratiformator vulcanicus]
MSSDITTILDKAIAGERLSPADGLALLQSHDLTAIGAAADAVCKQKHPEPYRTYNIDRNINYSNVCAAVCDFCAFYRPVGHEDAYVLSDEVLYKKIQETLDLGGDQILLQGGLHPKLPLEWYEDLLRGMKENFPTLNVHGFSPPELWHFSKMSKLPLREVLQRLKDAGLGSVPGGGGEILVDRVRKQITRGKVLSDGWLEVNRVWHEIGGHSTCTMMFGHVETLEERIEHMGRLRDLQDETGGFTAFICWTHQPPEDAPWFNADAKNGRKGGVDMSQLPSAGAFEYLKTQAISRLYLDNIPNIQSSWVTQGDKIGQVALYFGANDMGSLMIEENVVSQAGTVYHLSVESIRRCIGEAGYEPRQRNVFYDLIDGDGRSDSKFSATEPQHPSEPALPVLS